MKCPNCLKENNYDARYCLYCGSQLFAQTQTNTAWGTKIVEAIKSKLFFALCIITSVGLGFCVFSGSINILAVLATIFLWLVYIKAQKGVVDVNNMRNLSGTFYAFYVINYILSALLFLCTGILSLFAGLGYASLTGQIDQSFISEFNEALFSNPLLNSFALELSVSTVIVIIWIFVIILLVMSVVTLLINVFANRKIHRFIKSLYQSVNDTQINPLTHSQNATVWLWVFGIFNAVSSLYTFVAGQFMAGLSGICFATVYILFAIIIKQYFSQPIE